MPRAVHIAFGVIAVAVSIASARLRAEDISFAQIQRGKYLVDAADCVACHTNEKDKPFAGGRAIPTPFGTIYSANITPDNETGIGAWSDEEFYRALHFGVRPNGKRLYPAFPYPYFTKMPRDDVLAIRSYLRTLPPIKSTPPSTDFYWPLNYRAAMRGWDWLFFKPGEFKSDPQKSPEWNRGAYLVEGPGHCGACHTGKNILGADKTSKDLQGNPIQSWFAPKLVSDSHNGLGKWSIDEIIEYLKTGRNRYSGATGLMAEVVEHSTSKLNDSDLHAIATYLKDLRGSSSNEPARADQQQMNAGKAIFSDTCAACHQNSGEGVPRMFPPLKGNANVQSDDPTSTIRVILEGARTVTTDSRPTPSTMPPFGWKLNDAQVAAVATFVRNSWGNSAPSISAGQVKTLRQRLHTDAQASTREQR